MSVITEPYMVRADGVELVRTYSDEGRELIRNDGEIFGEAIDVKGIGYTYTEAETYVPDELSAEEVLEIILGGTTNETD